MKLFFIFGIFNININYISLFLRGVLFFYYIYNYLYINKLYNNKEICVSHFFN